MQIYQVNSNQVLGPNNGPYTSIFHLYNHHFLLRVPGIVIIFIGFSFLLQIRAFISIEPAHYWFTSAWLHTQPASPWNVQLYEPKLYWCGQSGDNDCQVKACLQQTGTPGESGSLGGEQDFIVVVSSNRTSWFLIAGPVIFIRSPWMDALVVARRIRQCPRTVLFVQNIFDSIWWCCSVPYWRAVELLMATDGP